VKKISLTMVALCAALAARADAGAKREFPADGVKSIRAQAGSGPIEIRAGAKIEVEVVENKTPELCLITMEVQDGVLVLKAENAKRWFLAHEGCEAGFRVSAPSALAVDATVGSGDIRASGRGGAVRLHAGSGDVVLDEVSGEADLSTGSGKISGTLSGSVTAKSGSGGVELKGLASRAEVKVGSGDATLAWAKIPSGSVEVRSGSGNVRLVFPAGTKLQASQAAGSGNTVNKLGETPGAPLQVSVRTGSGDSTIESAE
jgi:hypothetical protein